MGIERRPGLAIAINRDIGEARQHRITVRRCGDVKRTRAGQIKVDGVAAREDLESRQETGFANGCISIVDRIDDDDLGFRRSGEHHCQHRRQAFAEEFHGLVLSFNDNVRPQIEGIASKIKGPIETNGCRRGHKVPLEDNVIL